MDPRHKPGREDYDAGFARAGRVARANDPRATGGLNLRPFLVVALSCGVLWAFVGGMFGTYSVVHDGYGVDMVPMVALIFGVSGTLCGVGFAALLTRRGVSRGRGFPSAARAAVLGAFAAGSVVSVMMATAGFGLFPYFPDFYGAARAVIVGAILGSACAAGLVSVARRARDEAP